MRDAVFGFLFVLSGSNPVVLAASQDLSNAIQEFPSKILVNETIDFTAQTGYHLSQEAPQSCGRGHVSERSIKSVKCQYSEAGQQTARLNVCDDGNTFCKPVELPILVEGSTGTRSDWVRNDKINVELKNKMVPGFLQISPTEAKALAQKEGKPLLIMISTDWCPPCNETKENLIPTTEFQNLKNQWIMVYVDGDSPASEVWAPYAPFDFYPSFIALNSDLKEVSRFHDSLRVSEFVKWMDDNLLWIDWPLNKIRPTVVARLNGSWWQKVKDWFYGDSLERRKRDTMRVVENALARDDVELLRLLLKTGWLESYSYVEAAEFKLSELDRQEKKTGANLHDQKVELWNFIVDQSRQENGWGSRLAQFCDFDAKACQRFVPDIDKQLSLLKATPGLKNAERQSMMGEEYYYLMSVYDSVGDKASMKKMADQCVAEFASMDRQVLLNSGESRAATQGRIACLEAKGDFAKSRRLIQGLIAKYPTDPTFLMRMASSYKREKNFKEAAKWYEKADQVSFGYNWLRNRTGWVEALIELKKFDRAKDLLGNALDQIRVNSDPDHRDQAYLGRLRKLQVKLEKVHKNL